MIILKRYIGQSFKLKKKLLIPKVFFWIIYLSDFRTSNIKEFNAAMPLYGNLYSIQTTHLSLRTFPRTHPLVDGRFANGREWRTSHNFRDLWPFSSRSLSLSFHIFKSSIDGAVPMIPGWVKPGNRTPAFSNQFSEDGKNQLLLYFTSLRPCLDC